ncbi:MAG: MoaD/ThiS family protein [Sinobacteraceae bacterium]|nr:MoaD/ThiS family protein [Nevskia sp.]MDI3259002.1 MoaD/ThiS family protein [Nevskiaceae bacterium]
MKVHVECCGAAARWCGAEELSLDLADDATVETLLERLSALHPELARRRDRLAVAAGETVVPRDHKLTANERLALIPPVSGG